jgi:hypothetical protein
MLSGRAVVKRIAFGVGLTVVITAVTFFMLLTSESYEFAKGFVATDPRIAQLTGTQQSSRIAPLAGFRSAVGERTGEAHFTFKIIGDRGTYDVRVEIEKREGRWTVVKARAVSSVGAITEVVGASS